MTVLAQAAAIWMIYTTMFSAEPKPSLDENKFTDYKQCYDYLKVRYEPSTIEGFGLVCVPTRIVVPAAGTTG